MILKKTMFLVGNEDGTLQATISDNRWEVADWAKPVVSETITFSVKG